MCRLQASTAQPSRTDHDESAEDIGAERADGIQEKRCEGARRHSFKAPNQEHTRRSRTRKREVKVGRYEDPLGLRLRDAKPLRLLHHEAAFPEP